MMASTKKERWPIKITYFFLSLVGFGVADTKNKRQLLNIALHTSLPLSLVSCWFAGSNFYLTITGDGELSDKIDAAFLVLVVFLANSKLYMIAIKRQPYEHLLEVTDKTLWIQSWTDYGKDVLDECERQAIVVLFVFVILGHASGAGWVIAPLVLNIKGNSSDPDDRHLPVKPILGPISPFDSPYFELIFALDVFGSWVVTLLYFCFDYYLVLVNIFVVGQFGILKQRFEDIYTVGSFSLVTEFRLNDDKYAEKYKSMDYILREFKDCVKQHQFLIAIVEEVEGVHKLMNLMQVLVFSLIICIVGYQLLMSGSAVTLVKNGVFISSCLIQLFAMTLSCHNIMIASSDISQGIYSSGWYLENHTHVGRSLSKDFMMVLMKTKYPCYLTGCGFFPITLDTLKSIITTSFSYLTLIRQSIDE